MDIHVLECYSDEIFSHLARTRGSSPIGAPEVVFRPIHQPRRFSATRGRHSASRGTGTGRKPRYIHRGLRALRHQPAALVTVLVAILILILIFTAS